jgi:hypothetical protein
MGQQDGGKWKKRLVEILQATLSKILSLKDYSKGRRPETEEKSNLYYLNLI